MMTRVDKWLLSGTRRSLLQVCDAGAVPLLVDLLSSETPEAQDCAVGALANLAVTPQGREVLANANAIDHVIRILSLEGVSEGVKEMAVGTLTNLAINPANQVYSLSPTVGSVCFSDLIGPGIGISAKYQVC